MKTKTVYLVKCEGYCYKFSDEIMRRSKTVINYHCCTNLEEAKNDVRRWQKEERLENKKAAKEGKMQTWHNFKIEILDLY